jgi:histidine triad (HIT) family protein
LAKREKFMSDACLFCKIFAGQIPTTKIYEDEKVLGFKDINPLAAKHFLFIHKEHTPTFSQMMEIDPQQALDVLKAIKKYVADSKMEEEGFRIVVNQGHFGGQTVAHTHFHLLGGSPLGPFGEQGK